MGPLTHFVADITGKRSIEYTLTLPIGHSMAFIAIGFSLQLKVCFQVFVFCLLQNYLLA